MKKIVLIACCKKKNISKCQARDMYQSNLFRLSYKYAQQIVGDENIYILSAKYGLLDRNESIEPYDETLNTKNKEERLVWACKVVEQLKNMEIDIQNDEFVILAGKKYYENLIQYLQNYSLPLKNLQLGKRLKFLKDRCEESK